MQAKRRNGNASALRRGFTLVELMAVILILAILLAATFRFISFAMIRGERARALRDIEALRQALEEYYAHYGVYPPTVRGEYERIQTLPPLWPPDQETYFKTGLYWYLKVGPGRDRWEKYLEEVGTGGGSPPPRTGVHTPSGPGSQPVDIVWTNAVSRFTDPWGATYNYRVGRDYQSYRLWSDGPPDDPEGSVGDFGPDD